MSRQEVRKENGLIITFTGPSGTGKNTISQELIHRDERIRYFITATTRAPRAFEKEGVDYFFLSRDVFEDRLNKDDFLEWSEHYGNLYGALKEEVENKLSQGFDPLSDITYSGAKAIKEYKPEQTLSFLILPPSLEALDERMLKRQKTSAEISESQQQRLEKIREDIKHMHEEGYVFTNDDMKGSTLKDYDYVVINDNLEHVLSEIQNILEIERKNRV